MRRGEARSCRRIITLRGDLWGRKGPRREREIYIRPRANVQSNFAFFKILCRMRRRGALTILFQDAPFHREHRRRSLSLSLLLSFSLSLSLSLSRSLARGYDSPHCRGSAAASGRREGPRVDTFSPLPPLFFFFLSSRRANLSAFRYYPAMRRGLGEASHLRERRRSVIVHAES